MRKLLIASLQGGVGKTTTAIHLATAAAARENRVLLIDGDPQRGVAAAWSLPEDRQPHPLRVKQVIRQGRIWGEVLPGLDVLTPYDGKKSVEVGWREMLGWLSSRDFDGFYRQVIIDAPVRRVAELSELAGAADDILFIHRVDPLSLRLLPDLLALASGDHLSARVSGVALTLPEGEAANGALHGRLRRDIGGRAAPGVIPFDPEVQRALLLGKPLNSLNPNAPAVVAIRELASWLKLTGSDSNRAAATSRPAASLSPDRPDDKMTSPVEEDENLLAAFAHPMAEKVSEESFEPPARMQPTAPRATAARARSETPSSIEDSESDLDLLREGSTSPSPSHQSRTKDLLFWLLLGLSALLGCLAGFIWQLAR